MSGRTSRYLFTGLTALLLNVAAGCGFDGKVNIQLSPTVKGDGNVGTSTREIEEYASIEVHDAIHLDWQPSDTTTFEVTIEQNLDPLLETKVENGRLSIQFKENVAPTETVTIRTSSPALTGVHGSGATKINLKNVESDSFRVDLSGASYCRISGNVAHVRSKSSGSAQLVANDLASQTAEVESSGSSKIKITTVNLQSIDSSGSSRVEALNVKSQTLKINSSGSAHAKVSGHAERLVVNASGAARVDAPKLTLHSIDMNLSGAASVTVGKVEKVSGDTSGAAKFESDGQVKIIVD